MEVRCAAGKGTKTGSAKSEPAAWVQRMIQAAAALGVPLCSRTVPGWVMTYHRQNPVDREGPMSQPEAKSRAELRAGCGVPDTLGAAVFAPVPCLRGAGPLGSHLELLKDADWTWILGHSRA